jgi:exopolysaccharide biosynthesis polyprenyl glycosylphosphotransferase
MNPVQVLAYLDGSTPRRGATMSTISTRLPSAATVAETQLEVSRESGVSVARGRVRTPWALVAADVVAGLGTATVFLFLLEPEKWRVAMGGFVLAWPACVAVTGGYARALGVRHPVHARALVAAGGALAISGLALLAIYPGLVTGDTGNAARSLLLAAALTPLLSAGSRWVAGLLAAPAPTRVVLAGHADGVRTLFAEARRSSNGQAAAVVPAGICLDGAQTAEALELLDDATDLPVELEPDRLMELVRALDVDAVVVAPGAGLDHVQLRRWGALLQDEGVDLLVSPGLRDVATGRLSLGSLGGAQLLRVRPARLSGPTRALKELTDRAVAALLLVMLAPLLGLLVIMVRRDSPGPALFRQTRVGRHGHHFSVLKLRTMCMDADRIVDGLADVNEADRDGVLFKIKKDPRITRVGAKLRKYSLDELPQLVNVVRGEMSLVGPRPALPSEVAAYHRDLRRRLAVKPGLTGLWQVSGRSDLSWEDTVRLDLKYVDNWSWSLDLAIAARTLQAVLGHRGAY